MKISEEIEGNHSYFEIEGCGIAYLSCAVTNSVRERYFLMLVSKHRAGIRSLLADLACATNICARKGEKPCARKVFRRVRQQTSPIGEALFCKFCMCCEKKNSAQ